MTAREAALDQLDRIETRGSYVGYFTKAEKARLDPRDRRQATEYVAGVTRWRRRLDFILEHFCRSDYSKMEASLKHVLRPRYHLLFPAHLSITETHERSHEVEEVIDNLFPDDRVYVTAHLEPSPHRKAHPNGHREPADPLG